MTEPLPLDAAAVIKKYIELRDFRQEEEKLHRARMKPYDEAMEVLEAAAFAIMRTTGQDALSTAFGTAFKVAKMSVTCTDKDCFHGWVRERQAWYFLTAHVSKEAVEEYMKISEGQIPPGLKVDGHVAVQFRRA